MIASLPHFYKAEKLLGGIASGLKPNKKNHGIRILMETVSPPTTNGKLRLKMILELCFSEQVTGTPLSAAKRLQFSMDVKPIPEIQIMKTMPDVVFPLFWVEESAHLGRKYTTKLGGTVLMYANFYLFFFVFFLRSIQFLSSCLFFENIRLLFIITAFKWACVGLGIFGW